MAIEQTPDWLDSPACFSHHRPAATFTPEKPIMADENSSPANIAKALGVSDGKVKKAIKDLGLEPAAKRGVCSFYAPDQVAKIKAAVGA
jgi:hypothetical protein